MNKSQRFNKEDLIFAATDGIPASTAQLSNIKDMLTHLNSLIDEHKNIVEMLAEAKNSNNEYVFSADDVNLILLNIDNTRTPEKLEALLENPKEIERILEDVNINRGVAFVKNWENPLDSTIIRNPDVYPTEFKEWKTRDARVFANRISEVDLEDDRWKTMDNGEDDALENTEIMRKMVEEHPDIIELLAGAKDNLGKYLFDAHNINSILLNCQKTIENHPQQIEVILSDQQSIKHISSYEDRSYGLWCSLKEVPNKLILKNPEIFSDQFHGLRQATLLYPTFYPEITDFFIREQINKLRETKKAGKDIKTGIATTQKSDYKHISRSQPSDKQKQRFARRHGERAE